MKSFIYFVALVCLQPTFVEVFSGNDDVKFQVGFLLIFNLKTRITHLEK